MDPEKLSWQPMLFSSSLMIAWDRDEERAMSQKNLQMAHFYSGLSSNSNCACSVLSGMACPAHYLWVCSERITPAARDDRLGVRTGVGIARKKSYFSLGFLPLGNRRLQQHDFIMLDYWPCSLSYALPPLVPIVLMGSTLEESCWTLPQSFLLLTHWNPL